MQKNSTEEEEMKQQQRMTIMKDMMKKIRSKGRMDVNNWWWVSELLVAECGKAWLQDGVEDTMQKWYDWLGEMKKHEINKLEEMHQRNVSQMIKSADDSAGLLHRITKPTASRGGVQIFKEEKEDARLMNRREEKRKEWARHWQCDEDVQGLKDKPWENEMLKREEAALPRLREGDWEKVSRLCNAKTGVGCGVGCGGFHPKVPLDMTKETRGGVVEFLQKVECRHRSYQFLYGYFHFERGSPVLCFSGHMFTVVSLRLLASSLQI